MASLDTLKGINEAQIERLHSAGVRGTADLLMWGSTPDGRKEIASVAESAIREIEAGSDLQDVVLRAYRDMSRILQKRANLAEQHLRELTAREFEEQLEKIGVESEYVTQLTRLFERVRYGEHAADETERRESLTCLQAIEQAYREDRP